LRGHRLRVSILDEESADDDAIRREPNERMRAALSKAQAARKAMRLTDNSQTQKILREGRDGGMCG